MDQHISLRKDLDRLVYNAVRETQVPSLNYNVHIHNRRTLTAMPEGFCAVLSLDAFVYCILQFHLIRIKGSLLAMSEGIWGCGVV